jgi:putative ABC transport system permease protein
MFTFQLSLTLSEGLIFALVALGIYVAFQWFRFPDLTPDGSFVLGAAIYVKSVMLGVPPVGALGISIIAGAAAGACTALVNRVAMVPTVVSGLLVSSALYSGTWMLLGKPNQFLDPNLALVGNIPGETGAWYLFAWVAGICGSLVLALAAFSNSKWGLRVRAIGENALLARDLGTSESSYTLLSLGIANGIIGLAGALFAQRSFSADVNMGIGITLVGLAGMLLGLMISGGRRRILVVLGCLVIGAVSYKAVTFLALEAGFPAESFRLLTAILLLAVFFAIRASALEFLRSLKWS